MVQEKSPPSGCTGKLMNVCIVIIYTMPYEYSYKKEHIQGARQFLFPIPDMTTWDTKETGGKTEENYKAVLGPDKDKQIIVSSGFVKCTRSRNGAVWARILGYTNVYRQPAVYLPGRARGSRPKKPSR